MQLLMSVYECVFHVTQLRNEYTLIEILLWCMCNISLCVCVCVCVSVCVCLRAVCFMLLISEVREKDFERYG